MDASSRPDGIGKAIEDAAKRAPEGQDVVVKSSPKRKGDSDQHPATQLVLRTWWYRDAYRRVTLIMMALVAVVVVEGFIIAYLGVSKPAPRYVGLTADGRAIELKPLTFAYPDNLIAGWVANAVTELYTYNYVDYRKRFNDAHRQLLTPAGFRSYMASLERERTIETLNQYRYIVSGAPAELPVVLKKEVIGDKLRWHTQTKVLVRYDSVNTPNAKPQILIVDAWVVRVPENVATGGLQIERIITRVTR